MFNTEEKNKLLFKKDIFLPQPFELKVDVLLNPENERVISQLRRTYATYICDNDELYWFYAIPTYKFAYLILFCEYSNLPFVQTVMDLHIS